MLGKFTSGIFKFAVGIAGLKNGVAGFKAEVESFEGACARADSQLPQLERQEMILTQNSRDLVLVDEFLMCFMANDDELEDVDSVSEVKWYFNQNFDGILVAINENVPADGREDMWCMPIRYFTDESKAVLADIVRRIEEDVQEEDSLLAAPVGDLMALAFGGKDYEGIVDRSLGYDDGDDLIEVLKKVNSLSDYYKYVIEAGGPKGAGDNANGVLPAYIEEPSFD